MMFSRISRVRYVQNPCQSCLSRDRHICSVEALNHGWTLSTVHLHRGQSELLLSELWLDFCCLS